MQSVGTAGDRCRRREVSGGIHVEGTRYWVFRVHSGPTRTGLCISINARVHRISLRLWPGRPMGRRHIGLHEQTECGE
jgi:hypothetical protein